LTARISVECAGSIVAQCESWYSKLLNGGCTEDVAADRVWDALNCALERQDQHCFDPRDRLLENKLRTMAQKGR
jgi:hypothetical protein